MNKKCDEFYNRLKEHGYKLTTQRKIVLQTMLEHEEEHLTVEEIYHYIKDDHPEIGLATVYRNILILNEMKIVEKVSLDDGLTRYELTNEDEEHRHHHLICEVCGKIIEVKEDLMGNIENSFLETYGFLVHDHQAKFFGICKECQKKDSN
ncbi:MAG: transcriptional repressor [Vallitaleaceae bacterium]|nr:transcriptional repressor [Vallitaleaceae bacterium]